MQLTKSSVHVAENNTMIYFEDYGYNNFNFKVMSAEEIEYEDNGIDVVMANLMLFYVDDLNKDLREIIRVLKPNSRLNYQCLWFTSYARNKYTSKRI